MTKSSVKSKQLEDAMKNKLHIILILKVIVFSCQLNMLLHGKIPILTNPTKNSLDLCYNNNNMQTNGELTIIKELIKAGDIIFDVGANIGEWCAEVLIYHQNVKVYTFEPIPNIFETLKNKINNKIIFHNNVALSDTISVRTIRYYPQCSVLSTFYYRPIIEESFKFKSEILNIKTDTIDNFCFKNKIKKIKLLKIDTEGHEYEVFLGGIKYIKENNIDIIQFEYGGTYKDANRKLKEVYDYLSKFKYEIFLISPNGLIAIAKWNDNLENFQYSNYLAINRSTLKNYFNLK